jgi:hypothetical protein
MSDDARDISHECEVLLGRRKPGLVLPLPSLEHLQHLDGIIAELADRYVMAIAQLAILGDPIARMELSSRGVDVADATALIFPTKAQVHQ